MFFKGRKNKASAKKDIEPVVAAVIQNTVSSEIYQDILKENGIPCICMQLGADGYLKHIFGGATIPDYIYVKEEDYERACELYKTYIEAEEQVQILETEE